MAQAADNLEVQPSTKVRAELAFSRPDPETLLLHLSGSWTLGSDLPKKTLFAAELEASPRVRRIAFAAGDLTAWDSLLLTALRRLVAVAAENKVEVKLAGLPEGVRRLLALSQAVPERRGAKREQKRLSALARIGGRALLGAEAFRQLIEFLGGVCIGLVRLVRGRSSCRAADLLLCMQQSGAQALPIVTLISLLVGVILAFVGAVQLQMFGAEIFVANLVGIGMARDMAAMMTAVIMAGRTGAAYAAQLGTMQVNDEIDALRTLGISPIEFLVLPRLLALGLMLPLLCCYATLMGIVGGGVVCVGMFDLTAMQYYQQTVAAVPLRHFGVGMAKSIVYGLVVAFSGCLRGIQCGRSASAVGEATTSAVVTSIVWMVVWCAVLTVICYVIGI